MVKKQKNHLTFWGTAAGLFLFWVLITWRLHWQQLLVGALCAYGIVSFNREMLVGPAERPLLKKATFIKWISYFVFLVIAIFKSNWDMAKIVLSPKINISPCFVKYRTEVAKPLNRVILGNSITLTPGTLTVDIEGSVFLVHAITQAAAQDVASWDMMDRLAVIEEAENRGRSAGSI